MSTTEQCSSLHWRIPHFRFLWSLEEFAQCFQSETCFSKSLNFKKLPSISLLIDSIKRILKIKENLYFERKSRKLISTNQLINAFFDLMVVFCQNSCHFICLISVYVVMLFIKVTFCGKNWHIINTISKKIMSNLCSLNLKAFKNVFFSVKILIEKHQNYCFDKMTCDT